MDATPKGQPPIVIAHRGASGYRPEHTLEAYELAIQQGADFIEPDLVLTADGVLIVRHDNLLDLTTNVAEVAQRDPAIAALKTTKSVSGVELSGWFAEDFTLEQIRQLRAVERREGDPPKPFRPGNARFDGRFAIPTFADVIQLARRHGVGIYPETKHPTHIEQATGVNSSIVLLDTLLAHGIKNFEDLPTYIQSFEVSNLRFLNDYMSARGLDFPLIQLLKPAGQPFDIQAAGGDLTYDQMATPEGLAIIAQYADGVGPEKSHFLIPLDDHRNLDINNATRFVVDAHARGLLVHPFTFRAENRSLPANLQRGEASDTQFETAPGEAIREIQLYLGLGIDGFFTDQPDLGRVAVDRR